MESREAYNKPMSIYVAGLDLGTIRDPTALIIVEARGTKTRWDGEELDPELRLLRPVTRWIDTMPLGQCDVRHIERFNTGISYGEIERIVAQRVSQMPAPRYLAVDRTGVGVPVMERFAWLNPIGVMIHGGEKARRDEAGVWYMPKRDLIEVPQLLFQNKQIRIASGKLPNGTEDIVFKHHADLMFKELMNFKTKINPKGHDTYEAWREGEHDDLVLALSIACWAAQTIISTEAARQLYRPPRPPDWTISPY